VAPVPADPAASGAAVLADGALGADRGLGGEFARLVAVVARLRRDCPWDAEQTHASLAKHLVEETAETVDAIEAGGPDDLCEELGDLLIQICFHAELARQDGWFDVDDVACGVIAKLIGRHPWVFGTQGVPSDMMASWEAAKRAEKARMSALEGIPDAMSALARASKVITRVRDVHLDLEVAPSPSPGASKAERVGQALLALVDRAHAAGVDADQALRVALRDLEARVRAAEASNFTA